MIRKGLLIWFISTLLTSLIAGTISALFFGYVEPISIIILMAVLVLLIVPFAKTIREELIRRKKFVIVNTSLYAAAMLLGILLCMAAETAQGWDGLGYAILCYIVMQGATIGSLIAWIGNSIYWHIQMKKAA